MAVQKATHKKPARRFESSTAFADAVLASLTAGSGSRSRKTPPARAAAPVAQPLSSMGEAIDEPPRVSTGPKGLVPCPSCRIPLPMQPIHAGRKGRCVHCHVRLKVSKSLTKLIQLPEEDGGNRSKRSDGSGELVLGEKVFGWQMSKQKAGILAGILLAITLAVTIYLTVFLTGKSAEEELSDKVNSMRSTESP